LRAAYHTTVGRGLCSRRLQPLPSLPTVIAPPSLPPAAVIAAPDLQGPQWRQP